MKNMFGDLRKKTIFPFIYIRIHVVISAGDSLSRNRQKFMKLKQQNLHRMLYILPPCEALHVIVVCSVFLDQYFVDVSKSFMTKDKLFCECILIH